MKSNLRKKMRIAYWHKDGLDVYSYSNGAPIRIAQGTVESLRPVKSGLGIKLLIVGRERLMHMRKRYPPAPKEKLIKAVSLEIEGLFPFTKTEFYCRIFRSISNYSELDIWAWEADSYDNLRKVFPFDHVIPEDLFFVFAPGEPELRIFQHRGIVHMVANGKEGILDSTSVPLAGFDDSQIGRFLVNLNQMGEDVKKITIYGLSQFRISDSSGLEVVHEEERIYPPCLERIAQVNLGEFKTRREFRFTHILQPARLMRICIYPVLGYGLMLFLTARDYDQASSKIRPQIAAMDKKTVAANSSQPERDYSDVAREIDARLKKVGMTFKMLTMLAQRLPEGSFVNRIMMTEDTLELFLSSKDPLEVVRSLERSEMVKKVMIKGAPNKDRNTGLYTFAMALELTI